MKRANGNVVSSYEIRESNKPKKKNQEYIRIKMLKKQERKVDESKDEAIKMAPKQRKTKKLEVKRVGGRLSLNYNL